MANLKGSIYYPALMRLSSLPNPTLWDYEMAIDLFYFKWFWNNGEKTLSKAQLKYFKEAYGTKMDLLNVRWIYRSRHYFQMTPCGYLCPSDSRSVSPAAGGGQGNGGSTRQR